jgi:antitoxin VapB
MSLNIKNAEAHRLARELAEVTGGTLTDAVTEALRDRLAEAKKEDSFDLLLAEVRELQAFVAEMPDRDTRTPEEILGYDDHGLPG